MFSAAYKKRLATALAGAALASALVVSGASADPHAIDAYNRAANPPEVAPPPSSIAAPAGDEYQDLRMPDTRDAAEGYAPTLEPQPVADEPSEPAGFDLVSAAIGAVAAGALSLVLMATLGLRRPAARRAASALRG
jgi:hypothetical protein